MGKLIRVISIREGEVDPSKQQVAFTLDLKNQPSAKFIAQIEVAEQIASAISSFAKVLRAALTKPNVVAATPVSQYQAQKDLLSNRILVQIAGLDGILHMFAFPPDAASDLGEKLKAESAKAGPVGHA